MFGTLNARLDKLEEHFKACDQRAIEFRELEIKMSAQMEQIVVALNAHMQSEEKADKARRDEINKSLQQEQEALKTHTEILERISEKLGRIEQDLVSHPKDVQILLAESEKNIREYSDKKYAHKTELNSGLKSLRSQAGLVWTTLLISVSAVAWVLDTFKDQIFK